MKERIAEKDLIWIIFLVQFVTIFEFVIINPLAPDYIIDLGILSSQVGIIAGSFSLTSAVIGFIAVSFIDNHDRRKILLTSILGLMFSSVICLLSYDFKTFLLSKILAGLFAGPSTAISLAIVSDSVPAERRGMAISKAMSAFPIVAAFGVPIGLEISRYTGYWKGAFLLNLVIEFFVFIFAYKKLPVFDCHLKYNEPIKALLRYKNIFTNKKYCIAILLNLVSFFAGFCLIPNFANYFVFNLNYPREKLGLLFMIGGIISFFGMRLVGKIIDKRKSYYVLWILVLIMVVALYFRFLSTSITIPVLLFFIMFMFSMSSRNVVMSAVTSKIPSSHDRASFFSIYNVALNLGSGLGGMFSGFMLKEGPNLELVNIEILATISLCLTLSLPIILQQLERMIRRDARSS